MSLSGLCLFNFELVVTINEDSGKEDEDYV